MVTMQAIVKQLSFVAGKHHGELYVVGGCVRDHILQRKTMDIDVVVSRAPHTVATAFAALNHASCVTLDDDRHIYRVIPPETGYTIDIALMQGNSILDDLSRRDFTVNALSRKVMNGRMTVLIDPYNGMSDILKRRIKIISEKTLRDDPLRLIRAYRLHAELSFSIEPRSISLIRKHRRLVRLCAGERLRDELLKICATPVCGKIFKRMDETGLLTALMPELEQCRRVAREYYPRGGVLSHILETVAQMDYIQHNVDQLFGSIRRQIRRYEEHAFVGGYPVGAFLKLAALFHDIGKPSTAKRMQGRLRFFRHEEAGVRIIGRIAKRLRMSRKETHLLEVTARAHMRPGNLAYVDEITDRAIHRFFREYGDDGVAILLVSLADRFCYIAIKTILRKTDKHHRTILLLLRKYLLSREKILPLKLINGSELMAALHIPESPLVGKLLSVIYEAQSEGLLHSKNEAISFARQALLSEKN